MEPINQVMQRLKQSITFHSDSCPSHHIQMMIVGGNIICPRCEKDRRDAELTKQISNDYYRAKGLEKYNTLFSKSVIEDSTLLNARFDTFITTQEEDRRNKKLVMDYVERLINGEKFNLILQGKQGTGKSHLSYSTLFTLNETKKFSCLFISVDGMLRKIKVSFNDKESRYTEDYFNQLLSSVDFLCLDDLGAETGAIDSDRRATDFVQRVLYAATNVRQDKSTILTTNLDSTTLFKMYDKKLISRLLKSPEFVIFKESQDKRISKLPF